MLISIVVPFYNEAASLPILIRELEEWKGRLNLDVEYIAVDDGSDDGGADMLDSLKLPHLRVVRLRRNFGKSLALSAGFQEARGNVIVTLDADLQDNPENLPDFLKAIEDGYDVVSGWKVDRHDAWNRRVSSFLYNKMIGLLVGRSFHDINSGYKAYRRWAVGGVSLYGENHRVVLLNAALNGARIIEIPVKHRPRLYGRSKYRWNRLLSALMDFCSLFLFSRFFYKPLHFFGLLGTVPFIAGLSILTWVSVEQLIYWTALDVRFLVRPLNFFAVLLILGGLQLISIGLVAEYVLALKFRSEDPSVLVRYVSVGGSRREEDHGSRDPA